MKQHIVVTGGAGFIGSHLCEALWQEGHQVTCIDNFSTSSADNIRHLPQLEVIEGDVNTWETFDNLPRRTYDTLFHYAATVGVLRTEEQPQSVLQDVEGIRHVARLARQGRVKKIIFASSSEVYGHIETVPFKEESGVIGWSPYTTVKLYGEHMFASLAREADVPTISMRFFNVYGPRQRGGGYGFVVGKFIQDALQNKPPTIFGDGEQTRDFVYIDDNIRAALAALRLPQGSGQIINVGSGCETSIRKLADLVIEATGKEGVLRPVFSPARASEIRRRVSGVNLMHELLGIACQTSLPQGLKATAQWYQLPEEERMVAAPAFQSAVPLPD